MDIISLQKKVLISERVKLTLTDNTVCEGELIQASKTAIVVESMGVMQFIELSRIAEALKAEATEILEASEIVEVKTPEQLKRYIDNADFDGALRVLSEDKLYLLFELGFTEEDYNRWIDVSKKGVYSKDDRNKSRGNRAWLFMDNRFGYSEKYYRLALLEEEQKEPILRQLILILFKDEKYEELVELYERNSSYISNAFTDVLYIVQAYTNLKAYKKAIEKIEEVISSYDNPGVIAKFNYIYFECLVKAGYTKKAVALIEELTKGNALSKKYIRLYFDLCVDGGYISHGKKLLEHMEDKAESFGEESVVLYREKYENKLCNMVNEKAAAIKLANELYQLKHIEYAYDIYSLFDDDLFNEEEKAIYSELCFYMREDIKDYKIEYKQALFNSKHNGDEKSLTKYYLREVTLSNNSEHRREAYEKLVELMGAEAEMALVDNVIKCCGDYADNGEYSKAVDKLERIRELVKENDTLERHYILWKDASAMQNLPKGNSYFAKAIRADLAEKNLEKSIKYLRLSLEEEKNEKTYKHLVNLLYRTKHYEEAIAILKEHRKDITDSKWVDDNLINLYRSVNQYDNAVFILKYRLNYARSIEEKYELMIQIGDIYKEINDIDNAIEFYSTAIRYNPEEGTKIKKKMARCYISADKLSEAENILNEILVFNSDEEVNTMLKEIHETKNNKAEKVLSVRRELEALMELRDCEKVMDYIRSIDFQNYTDENKSILSKNNKELYRFRDEFLESKDYESGVNFFIEMLIYNMNNYTIYAILSNIYENLKYKVYGYMCSRICAMISKKYNNWIQCTNFCVRNELHIECIMSSIELLKINPQGTVAPNNIENIVTNKKVFSPEDKHSLGIEVIEQLKEVYDVTNNHVLLKVASAIAEQIGDRNIFTQKYRNILVSSDSIRGIKEGINLLKEERYQEARELLEAISKEKSGYEIVEESLKLCSESTKENTLNKIYLELLGYYPVTPPIWQLVNYKDKCIEKKEIKKGIEDFNALHRIFPEDMPIIIDLLALYEEEKADNMEENIYQLNKKLINLQVNLQEIHKYIIKTIFLCFEYDFEDRLVNILKLYDNIYDDKKEGYVLSAKKLIDKLYGLKEKIQKNEQEDFKKMCVTFRRFSYSSYTSYICELNDSSIINNHSFIEFILNSYRIQTTSGLTYRFLSSLQNNEFSSLEENKYFILASKLSEEHKNAFEVIARGYNSSQFEYYKELLKFDYLNSSLGKILLSEDMALIEGAIIISNVALVKKDRLVTAICSALNKNNPKKFIRILTLAIEYHNHYHFLFKLAEMYYYTKEFDKTLECYDRALEQLTDDTKIKMSMNRRTEALILMQIQAGKLNIEGLEPKRVVDALLLIANNVELQLEFFNGKRLAAAGQDKLIQLLFEYVYNIKILNFNKAYDTLMENTTELGGYLKTCLKRLYKRCKDEALKFQIYSEVEKLKYLEDDEEDSSGDGELSDPIEEAPIEDNSENKEAAAEIITEDKNREITEETLNQQYYIREIAPNLWDKYILFDLDDARTPSKDMLKEVKQQLDMVSDVNQRQDIYLKLAKISYNLDDLNSYIYYLIEYGSCSVKVALGNKEYKRCLMLIHESLRLIDSNNNNYRMSALNELAIAYLEALMGFDSFKEIMEDKEDIKWTCNLLLDRNKNEGLNKIYRILQEIILMVNDYDNAAEIESKHKIITRISFKLDEMSRIRMQNKLYAAMTRKIILSWKKLIYSESDNLYEAAMLNVEVLNSQGKLNDSIFIQLINKGKGYAEDVKVSLNLRDAGSCINAEQRIGGINGGEIIPFYFNYKISSPNEYEMDILVEYKDGKDKIKEIKHSFVIKVVANDDKFQFINSRYSLGPVESTEDFFGRKQILKVINENLKGDRYDNVMVIHGLRRVGKTSLLKYIYTTSQDRFIPIFIDMQNFSSCESTSYFVYSAFIKELEYAFMSEGIDIEIPEESYFENEPLIKLVDFLKRDVPKVIGDKKILILFDEFEELFDMVNNRSINKGIFSTLRSMMQHVETVRFILCGADKVLEMMRDYASIIFQIASAIPVKVLDREEAIQLIVDPVKDQVVYLQPSIERILALTGGHPYYTKIVCNGIIKLLNEVGRYTVYPSDVDKVISDIIYSTNHDYFKYLWVQSSEIEKLIISTMAKELEYCHSTVTLSYLNKQFQRYKNIAQGDIIKALERLRDRTFIREIKNRDSGEDSYGFNIDLYRQWFKQTQPIEKTLMEVGKIGEIQPVY